MPSRNDTPINRRTRSTSSGRTPSKDATRPPPPSTPPGPSSGTTATVAPSARARRSSGLGCRRMWPRGGSAPERAARSGGCCWRSGSMTLTQDGRYEAAVWVLFVAACVDVADDGAVARALGASTPFGHQLDSLADLVAAGVAPAFLVTRCTSPRGASPACSSPGRGLRSWPPAWRGSTRRRTRTAPLRRRTLPDRSDGRCVSTSSSAVRRGATTARRGCAPASSSRWAR